MTVELEEEPTRADLIRLHLENLLREGISQRFFSRETGIPRATINDFLRERHEPTERTLDRFEEALGWSDDDFSE